MEINFDYKTEELVSPLRANNEYKHSRKLTEDKNDKNIAPMTWLNTGNSYSISTNVTPESEIVFSKLGTNDPEFNLRKNHVFIDVIEHCKNFDLKLESVQNLHGNVTNIEPIFSDNFYTIVQINFNNDQQNIFLIANQKNVTHKQHKMTIGNQKYQWTENYNFKTN